MSGTEKVGLCLSRTEVQELTRAHTRARQCAFLVRNGIRHYVDAHGWPVVLRATLEGPNGVAQDRPRWKSNKAA